MTQEKLDPYHERECPCGIRFRPSIGTVPNQAGRVRYHSIQCAREFSGGSARRAARVGRQTRERERPDLCHCKDCDARRPPTPKPNAHAFAKRIERVRAAKRRLFLETLEPYNEEWTS